MAPIPFVWVTADGREIPISTMSDRHIRNALRLLIRRLRSETWVFNAALNYLQKVDQTGLVPDDVDVGSEVEAMIRNELRDVIRVFRAEQQRRRRELALLAAKSRARRRRSRRIHSF